MGSTAGWLGRLSVTDRWSPERRLFLLSAVMLFVELALIRWVAANVVYLAFFTNFVLLAGFLGIGIGFLRASRPRDRFPLAPIALALFMLFVTLFPVEMTYRDGYVLVGLGGVLPPLPSWFMLPALFVGAATVMALITEGVARTFALLAPLEAYRVDIAGSLTGILAFTAVSFMGAPPVVWFGLTAIALAVTQRSLRRHQLIGLSGIVLLGTVGSVVPNESWSPYYRVTASPRESGEVGIRVNGLPHQEIMPVSRIEAEGMFYLDPYDHLAEPPRRVLIVGAGNGNDVAVALTQGPQVVDAVEIDPDIQELGARWHPDRPYQDPRVRVHIDDGRAFIQRTDERYDLILFALPDSLTLLGGQSSLRLESYLFTEEALATVRERLTPGGTFAMYNYYRADVFDRFAATMHEAFGHPPCVDHRPDEQVDVRRQAVLMIGLAPDDVECSPDALLDAGDARIDRDDHPFPYLRERTIPPFYLVSLGMILLASLVGVRAFGGPFGRMRPYADLFFMGVAFLLLETTNVVRFALLFGTTWLVNALVFAGILLAVLAAVETARKFRLPHPWVLFAALGGAIGVAWLVPTGALLEVSVLPRFVGGVLLAFTPVYLANLIFSQRFREVGSSTTAFGANLLGAMVGGVVEYLALVTGYRALLLVVAAVYLIAMRLLPRERVSVG